MQAERMKQMNEILNALRQAGTFYLATVEDNMPKVRPHGFAMEYRGKLCFSTGNQKPTFRQLMSNPNVEICAMFGQTSWLRLHGKARRITDEQSREAALAEMPALKSNYGDPDKYMEIFCLEDASADIYSFGPTGIETRTVPC